MQSKTRIGMAAVGVGIAAAVVLLALREREAPASTPAPVVAAGGPAITVYKSPTCLCCANWVEHLRTNGFTVRTVDLTSAELMQLKATHGVTADLAACHTGLIEGYVVEGHVPADDVARLLRERPPIAGVAVPGMPIGSPGMEGGRPEPYTVLTFDGQGRTGVFANH